MLTIARRAAAAAGAPADRLELPYELRCRSRFRATLAGGEAVAVFLERGQVLRGGDLLLGDDGRIVEVRAAPEEVSTAQGDDALQLLRAAYHLGNRHVALQIGAGWLRYLHDHVLDDMLRGLGLRVRAESAPFEPETGAYAAGHAGPAAAHGRGHGHGHGDGDGDGDGDRAGQEPEHARHEHGRGVHDSAAPAAIEPRRGA
jgi:urease accessory protein